METQVPESLLSSSAKTLETTMNLSANLKTAHEREAATQRNQTTRFLRLAPELRNRIYNYVFSDDIVDVRPDKTHGKTVFRLYQYQPYRKGSDIRAQDTPQELSPLKYVCRQLHFETRGMGLGNKTLYFPRGSQPTDFATYGMRASVLFLSMCSPSSKAKITDIMDDEVMDVTWELTQIDPLADFCRAHPSARVGLRMDSDDLLMFTHMTMLTAALRKKMSIFAQDAVFGLPRSVRGIFEFMGLNWDKPTAPDNFRVTLIDNSASSFLREGI
ncbi:hypothetical protein CC80DRAFT_498909 [Byssothecium circinans]|uniref:Uncharacterized protein n=1 Tax=Byssothecium circinans TaxID=147558 RepID=A0A6A5UGM9_9PLEO|nr:hypothetical protein CC80DRAFT_498909 [Byssothecium circinans]